jgi:hypothetical protein
VVLVVRRTGDVGAGAAEVVPAGLVASVPAGPPHAAVDKTKTDVATAVATRCPPWGLFICTRRYPSKIGRAGSEEPRPP